MFNIIEYLDDKGVRYWTSGKNVSQGWIGTQCPFCHDRSNHLGINLTSGGFSCFVCGTKGKFPYLVQTLENTSPRKAAEILKPYMKGILTPLEETITAEKLELPETIKELQPLHRSYLHSRNFSEKIYEKYKLRCFGHVGEYNFRFFIPFFYKGHMVTFTTRDVTNKSRIRYLTCPVEKSIIPVKQTLYNIDNAKDVAIVVEGPTDVWRIGDGAVALHGVNYTPAQIKLLAEFRKVYVLLDATAMNEAEKLAMDIAPFTDVEILELKTGDPADLPESEVKKLRERIL